MRKRGKMWLGGLAVLLLILSIPVQQLYQEYRKAASEDPLVWEEDIAAFEQAARDEPPPQDAVVFVGSSSIRLWQTLARDMAPIPVIQRGFGGAKMNDVVHYAERLENAWSPAAVVVFAGTNDITPQGSKPPERILASYRELVRKLRAGNPQLPIYYIAITPSPSRWEVWETARATNDLIRAFSLQSPGLHFVDTGPALLNAQGEPDPVNYMIDSLHLSKEGYRVWTSIIRPLLLQDLPGYGIQAAAR